MSTLPPDAGTILLPIARAAIAEQLGESAPEPDRTAPFLAADGACFVTLHTNGHLRGCIGTIEPHRSLGEDVAENAIAAAFRDPRFQPLARAEYPDMVLEVSVLSPREEIRFADRADAYAQIRPGIDGILFTAGFHRATFLPQVWAQMATVEEFMGALLRKAGLTHDYWSDGVKLERYTVESFEE
ncbi:AmmeMemoRadiSam system protein A [Granulicoccus phenolivorans]|uniref:AmmeMemoRadiSam system protein A n=1 Tax=Granulicoccus phenolivorans TaxID=266854 RepID=UPI000428FB60|nr:AmmeMemoRadiSam system protein A [Granulicoccus phenolivorans]